MPCGILRRLLFLDDANAPFGLLVRIVYRLVCLCFVGIEAGRDTHLEVAHLQVRRERASNILTDRMADIAFKAQKIVRRLFYRIRTARDELAVDIQHRDLIDLHVRHGRGDEVADRLPGGAVVAVVGTDDDRCGGRLALPAERAFVSEHDVYARRFDAAHHLDRPREFALDGADTRDFLHERGKPQRAELVVQLVAHASAVREAFFGEGHTRLCGLTHGDHYGGPIRAYIERDAGLAERGSDSDHVVTVETRIQGFRRGTAEVVAGKPRGDEHEEANETQRCEAARAKGHQVRHQPLGLRQRVHRPTRVTPISRRNFASQACAGVVRREEESPVVHLLFRGFGRTAQIGRNL